MDIKTPLIVKTNIKKVDKTPDTSTPTIYSPASVVDNINKLLESSTSPKIYWKKNKILRKFID